VKILSKIKKFAVFAVALSMTSFTGTAVVFANDATPGQAGQTKVNIYDNTDDGWNVTVGDPDPVIGFVNFLPAVNDPNSVKVVVALKDGAPSCDYNIDLVTSANNDGAGLAPDGFHSGFINTIGTLTTNAQGKGNSGEITVDVTTLTNVAASGDTTYAHVDLEDHDGDCTESDGTTVANNEYGASGKQPSSTLDLPVNIHWTQP
jgi:hypothetical protein